MEPTYEYVRGKGWIACMPIVTMRCGTVVRLELRKPELGERHTWNNKSDNWTLDKDWKIWARNTDYEANGEYDGYEPRNREIDWLVMIPVNP